MRILVVNIGSSSRKYALFDRGAEAASARMEKSGPGGRAVFAAPGLSRETALSPEEYSEGTRAFLRFLAEAGIAPVTEDGAAPVKGPGGAFATGPGASSSEPGASSADPGTTLVPGGSGPGAIDRIALRVVAPGTFFQANRRVDAAYLARLAEAGRWAPLHVEPVLEEARRLRARMPELGILAISDSAFHASLPEYRRRYALPAAEADARDLFRFGYHGISVRSVLRKAAAAGREAARAIVCHLGSGASVTAARDGRSADTSMGFSPLEGLIMGTRPGDLDPGAVIYLAKAGGMGPDELEAYLNGRCGLLGLSGISPDMRVLLAREAEGDAGARLAVEAFVDRVRKYVGAYFAVLGGLDLLAFTGGIGERSEAVRRRICAGLEGTVLKGPDDPRVAVIPSAEMEEMARQAEEFTDQDAAYE
jgi:acetate kinase